MNRNADKLKEVSKSFFKLFEICSFCKDVHFDKSLLSLEKIWRSVDTSDFKVSISASNLRRFVFTICDILKIKLNLWAYTPRYVHELINQFFLRKTHWTPNLRFRDVYVNGTWRRWQEGKMWSTNSPENLKNFSKKNSRNFWFLCVEKTFWKSHLVYCIICSGRNGIWKMETRTFCPVCADFETDTLSLFPGLDSKEV